MKKTILRIIGCILIVAIAFGISWLVGWISQSNAETTPDTPIVHTCEFGEWSEVVAATCTEPGKERRTCECGEFEERDIPALGHTCRVGICDRCGIHLYHSAYCGVTKKVSSSCQESKHITGICDGCGEAYDVEIIPFDHQKFLGLYKDEEYIEDEDVIRCVSEAARDARVKQINNGLYVMFSWFFADYPDIVAVSVGETDFKIVCGTCGDDITSICFADQKVPNSYYTVTQ